MTRRQRLILLIGFTLALNTVVFAQPTLTPPADVPTGRIFTLYGDFKVFELQGDVPPQLRDVSLYSLDIVLLQAGASMKGDFESR